MPRELLGGCLAGASRRMCANGYSQAENEECPRKTGPDRLSFRRECPFKLEPAYTPAPPARLADGLELESAPIGSLRPAPREQAALMLKAVSFQVVPPLPVAFGPAFGCWMHIISTGGSCRTIGTTVSVIKLLAVMVYGIWIYVLSKTEAGKITNMDVNPYESPSPSDQQYENLPDDSLGDLDRWHIWLSLTFGVHVSAWVFVTMSFSDGPIPLWAILTSILPFGWTAFTIAAHRTIGERVISFVNLFLTLGWCFVIWIGCLQYLY